MYKNLVTRRACALAVTSFCLPFVATAHAEPPPLKVAFVYVTPLSEVGWDHQHELGRLAVNAALGGQVQTS